MATKNSKLSLFNLVTMGVGCIIGSGIFAMIGSGIAMTGRSVSIALVVGCFVNLVVCAPFMIPAGMGEMRGGIYGLTKFVLKGRFLSGMFGVLQLFSRLALSIYAIAIVEYLASLVPFIGEQSKIFSFVILVLFFWISTLDIKAIAKFQDAVVIILIVALALFVAFGVGEVQPNYFGEDGFFTQGYAGFAMATAALTFASVGASALFNLYEVTETPQRNFPLAVFISTGLVAVLYFLVAYVASGVLPLEEVSGQSLAVVSAVIFPTWIHTFFVVGGALMALASTLNNMLSYTKYPMQELARDGYLPPCFLKETAKGVAIWPVGVTFVLACIPLVTGLDVTTIVSAANAPMIFINAIWYISVIQVPKRYPEQWAAAGKTMKQPVVVLLCVAATVLNLATSSLMLMVLTGTVRIIAIVVTALVAVYVLYINKKQAALAAKVAE